MSHLDDGTLRRWLDEPGALDSEAAGHAAGCAPCQARAEALRAAAAPARAALSTAPDEVDAAAALAAVRARSVAPPAARRANARTTARTVGRRARRVGRPRAADRVHAARHGRAGLPRDLRAARVRGDPRDPHRPRGAARAAGPRGLRDDPRGSAPDVGDRRGRPRRLAARRHSGPRRRLHPRRNPPAGAVPRARPRDDVVHVQRRPRRDLRDADGQTASADARRTRRQHARRDARPRRRRDLRHCARRAAPSARATCASTAGAVRKARCSSSPRRRCRASRRAARASARSRTTFWRCRACRATSQRRSARSETRRRPCRSRFRSTATSRSRSWCRACPGSASSTIRASAPASLWQRDGMLYAVAGTLGRARDLGRCRFAPLTRRRRRSRRRRSPNTTTASSRCAASRWTSRAARSSVFWDRTARARRPSSRCCSASCARPPAKPRCSARRSAIAPSGGASDICPSCFAIRIGCRRAKCSRCTARWRRSPTASGRAGSNGRSASSDSPSAATRESARFRRGCSSGSASRVALLGDPAIVFLDEPTSALDPVGRHEVRAIIEDQKRRGTTVFLNSHLLTEVERVCDRVAIVDNGAVVDGGTVEALTRGVVGARLRLEGVTPAVAALLRGNGHAVRENAGWHVVQGLAEDRDPRPRRGAGGRRRARLRGRTVARLARGPFPAPAQTPTMLTIVTLTLREAVRRRVLASAGVLTRARRSPSARGASGNCTRRCSPRMSEASALASFAIVVLLLAYMFSIILSAGAAFIAAPAIASDVESGVVLAMLPRPDPAQRPRARQMARARAARRRVHARRRQRRTRGRPVRHRLLAAASAARRSASSPPRPYS